MKLWISMSSILADLENVRRVQDKSVENDYEPDLEDLDKSPVPIFHFGRTNMATTVFFNYNYLLRGGRRISHDTVTLPNNVLRYLIFRSDDLMRNRSAKPLGYFDLVVDDRHKVRDILGIYRAWVDDDHLDLGIREEIITSLLKTLEHGLTVHSFDENVLRVLKNLNTIDVDTGGPVSPQTRLGHIPYDLKMLTTRVEMSKHEQRRVWNTRNDAQHSKPWL